MKWNRARSWPARASDVLKSKLVLGEPITKIVLLYIVIVELLRQLWRLLIFFPSLESMLQVILPVQDCEDKLCTLQELRSKNEMRLGAKGAASLYRKQMRGLVCRCAIERIRIALSGLVRTTGR